MKRREMLVSTATLAAAFSLPTGLDASSPRRHVGGTRLKIGLNAYSFSKLLNDYNKGLRTGISLFELIDFCSRNNFDAIDPTGYFFPEYPKVPSDSYVNEFKRRCFEAGLDISGTGVRNNFTIADKAKRAADVQHIKDWVEVAARMGAPVLRVFCDTQLKSQTWETASEGATRQQVENWIVDHLSECTEHGKKFGVIIGIQNHGDFLKTSDEHLSLIHRVDSDWCGAIVDTGYYRTSDPYQDIAAVAPYAVNWQVKESPIGPGSGVSTDLIRLMTIVRQSGYRGYLPIETLSASNIEYDPFQRVPSFLAEVRKALDVTIDVVSQVAEQAAPPPPISPPLASTSNTAVTPANSSALPTRKKANKNKTFKQ